MVLPRLDHAKIHAPSCGDSSVGAATAVPTGGPALRVAVAFHPAADPPAFGVGGADPGDRLSLSGEVVELSALDGLADHPVDERLERLGAGHRRDATGSEALRGYADGGLRLAKGDS